MVTPIIRVLGSESSVGSSGSDFSGKQLIRVYNPNASDVLITIANGATTVGTFTLRSYETAYVNKAPVETVAAATACKMVPVAF